MWGTAEEVPGTAALNAGGDSRVQSVSCGAAGDCAAGGFYVDSSGHGQAFVVNETNGTWRTAEEVPGTATLNQGGGADVISVSCTSVDDCSAGGQYTDSSGHLQAFVVNKKEGSWGTAEEVPGTAALNTGGFAQILAVSCSEAGNCSAGGRYFDSGSTSQAFVVSETNGVWGTAEKVPGTAALNQGGFASLDSVSCASEDNCSAGGSYANSSGGQQAFVVNRTDGTWRTAEEVPGIAALNTGGFARLNSVSCGAAGNCSAGGFYTGNSLPTVHSRAFVVSEKNGVWGTASRVPGLAILDQGRHAEIRSVSCASAGDCSAGGSYANSSGGQQAFVVNRTDGTWGPAEEVPGTAALNMSGGALVESVSCASAGNCSAVGDYATFGSRAFVVDETNGTWGTAEEVPGTAALDRGQNAAALSVSCATVNHCSAGGFYSSSRQHQQAFVVNKT